MPLDDSLWRPSANALRFRLYDRALHPEWLTMFALRRVRYAGHTIAAGILAGGHIFQWHRDNTVLTEVVSAEMDLPPAGLVLDREATHGCRAKVKRPDGLRYEIGSQIEHLSPEVFRQVHAELAHDGCRGGLVFHFPNHGRVGLGPIGFLTVQTVPSGLVFCSFHTFPDELAVVKTQSLIDFSEATVPA